MAGPKPLRILIADDHKPTRDDVCRALEGGEEFEICAVAVDAAQAVQAALRERPDVCLLDVGAQGTDGQVCVQILERQAARNGHTVSHPLTD